MKYFLLNFGIDSETKHEPPRAAFSPTPPCMPRKKTTPAARTRRSFPSPPVSPCYDDANVDNRPHTVAQIRSERTEKQKDCLINSIEITNDIIKENEETFNNM